MKFKYKAYKHNKLTEGEIEAESEDKVRKYLISNNYIIVGISEQRKRTIPFIDYFLGKVSFTDVVDLTRQLAIMLNAGLTIVDSLEILRKQIKKPALLKIVNQIDEDVRAGNSLSYALKKHRRLFSNLYISLVKAGEASGKMDEILLKLADNLEKEREFRGKIKGALIYPVIIIIGMLAVMFIMITFVVPQLLSLYKDFDIDLPFTTQVLIALSSFLQKFWLVVLGLTFVGFSMLRKFFSTDKGKKLLDTFLLKIPRISNVIKISALVDTTRTLAILITAGVSILDALDIVIETSSNIVYQEAFRDIYGKVEKGASFGKSLSDEEIFPPILIQMATVGEQTGHLHETMMRLSKYFEMESELSIKGMTTLIEPAILVFLGLGVGFLVLSVITPIYNLTSSFQ